MGFVLGALIVPLIAKAITVKDSSRYPHSPETFGVALEARGMIIGSDTSDFDLSQSTAASYESPAASAYSVLERIALCESQNNPLAKNPSSSASGRFQFLKGSWEAYGRQLWGTTEGKDVFSYKDNTELAEYVYSIEGTKPWISSIDCWGR